MVVCAWILSHKQTRCKKQAHTQRQVFSEPPHTNLWKSKSMEEKRDCKMAHRAQKKLDALRRKHRTTFKSMAQVTSLGCS